MPAKKGSGGRRTARSSSRTGGPARTRAREASGTRTRASAGAGSRARTAAPPEPSPFTPGFAPECLACPFGVLFFAMRQTRPDAMEHVMRAGYELFQALRAVMDQTAERWEQAKTLERIPIS